MLFDIASLIPETLSQYENLIPNHVFFFSSLIFVMAIVWKIPVLSKKMESVALENNERVFSANSPYEFNKFALLRIVFGVLITLRGAHVLSLLLNSELNTAVGFYVIAEVVAGLMLIFGLFTQWAFIFLLGAMWQIGDYVVGKSTLGNDVAAIFSMLLIMVNAGKYLSVDSLLIKKFPALHRFLLYYRGIPSGSIIFYAKFTALFSYWCVCVYSFSTHLNEIAWTTGTAGPLLLTNNFMTAWHAEFTELFTKSSLAVFMAKVSLWLMILWYCTVLPFVLIGGYFRQYVIVWGWMFIALSLFVLQLGGYLAEIEVLFWLALFWTNLGMRQNQSIHVLYDDRCNLCDRTVQIITILDIFGQVHLKPISKNKKLLVDLDLKLEDALTDLYGVRDGDNKLFQGYDFYIQLSRSLVLLWPVFPLLILGKMITVGPVLYRFIAQRRRRLFGICYLPRRKYTVNKHEILSQSRIPNVLTLHVLLLGLLYFLAMPAPFIGYNGFKNYGANAAHIYGIRQSMFLTIKIRRWLKIGLCCDHMILMKSYLYLTKMVRA